MNGSHDAEAMEGTNMEKRISSRAKGRFDKLELIIKLYGGSDAFLEFYNTHSKPEIMAEFRLTEHDWGMLQAHYDLPRKHAPTTTGKNIVDLDVLTERMLERVWPSIEAKVTNLVVRLCSEQATALMHQVDSKITEELANYTSPPKTY